MASDIVPTMGGWSRSVLIGVVTAALTPLLLAGLVRVISLGTDIDAWSVAAAASVVGVMLAIRKPSRPLGVGLVVGVGLYALFMLWLFAQFDGLERL